DGALGGLDCYPLQNDGAVASSPSQVLELTVPPSLATVVNYPLRIAFHPVLPLVYVWQDIPSPYAANPEGYIDLCHLAIYRSPERNCIWLAPTPRERVSSLA